jgi:hypothetical protein
MKALMITITALLTFSLSANAHQGSRHHNSNRGAMYGKVKLGAMTIHENTERNVIKLSKCGPRKANKKVSKIKLLVKSENVQIDKLKVTFQNGAKQVLNVKDHFRVGETSRWIDLKGQKRCIKKIITVGDADTFGYNLRKKSRVVFYGM